MKVILVGAGGHAKACISCLESSKIEILGLLDRDPLPEARVLGYPILGSDAELGAWLGRSDAFLISVGQIESAKTRQRLFELVLGIGGKLPSFCAIDSRVHWSASLGDGTLAMHRVLVNSGASVGRNCILNSGCIIEHDVTVGDHVHVSTAAVVNGDCRIGDRVFVGSGSVIANGISIGSDIVVGAGSLVLNNLNLPGVYAGSPVRRIR